MNDNNFSDSHEKANVWSHAVGILITIFFIPFFFFKVSKIPMPALFLYLASILAMFTSSTTYHFLKSETLKKKWRVIDHIAIFWVIGSTALPFVILFKDDSFYFILCQWSLILIGSIMKIFFTGRFRLLSSLFYVCVGFMVLFLGKDFWKSIPDRPFNFLLTGGVLFLLGVYFYQNRKIPYNHFIWHLFVLTAVLLQAYAVYLLI